MNRALDGDIVAVELLPEVRIPATALYSLPLLPHNYLLEPSLCVKVLPS